MTRDVDRNAPVALKSLPDHCPPPGHPGSRSATPSRPLRRRHGSHRTSTGLRALHRPSNRPRSPEPRPCRGAFSPRHGRIAVCHPHHRPHQPHRGHPRQRGHPPRPHSDADRRPEPVVTSVSPSWRLSLPSRPERQPRSAPPQPPIPRSPPLPRPTDGDRRSRTSRSCTRSTDRRDRGCPVTAVSTSTLRREPPCSPRARVSSRSRASSSTAPS